MKIIWCVDLFFKVKGIEIIKKKLLFEDFGMFIIV